MFKRTFAVFALGAAAILFSAAQTDAQPQGKGGFGKGGFGGFGGKGPNPEVQKLEAEVSKLQEQVKDLEAKLEKAKKGGFEGKGFGRDFAKGKGFEMKKPDFKKEMAKGEFPGFGKGGLAKLDPATVKEKFEYYKKLYEESKSEPKGKGPRDIGKGREFGKGKGPAGESGSVEARLDRLTRELEELRNEMRAGKGKKKF